MGGDWLKKKVSSLAVPYIVWSFINPIMLLGISQFNIMDILDSAFITNQSYWYLGCLFILSIIYYLLQKSPYKTGLIPVALIIVSVIAFLTKNPYIEQAMGYFPFFYIGILIIRFDIIRKIIENDWIMVVSLLAFLILVRVFDKFDSSFYMLVVRCLCGALIIPTFLKIAKMKIFFTRFGGIIRTYGKNSLIIYLCHYFFVSNLGLIKTLELSSIETMVYISIMAAVICTVCVFIGNILENNSILKKILLGKK